MSCTRLLTSTEEELYCTWSALKSQMMGRAKDELTKFDRSLGALKWLKTLSRDRANFFRMMEEDIEDCRRDLVEIKIMIDGLVKTRLAAAGA